MLVRGKPKLLKILKRFGDCLIAEISISGIKSLWLDYAAFFDELENDVYEVSRNFGEFSKEIEEFFGNQIMTQGDCYGCKYYGACKQQVLAIAKAYFKGVDGG
jgi:hypothetical protein